MSHGNSGPDKCEPNLVPLLDLVLQLIMFFMLCANFIDEQVNRGIDLPKAVAARPLDKEISRFIYLNVNKQGQVLLSKDGKEALNNKDQIYRRMRLLADGDDNYAKYANKDPKATRSVVILRADTGATWKMVYDVMTACRAAGYEKVQLRAKVDDK
jgi:biopolymer transport protein ExbD